MLARRLLVALAIAVVAMMAVGSSVAAAGKQGKELKTEMIVLQNASPQYLMMLMGLCSEDELLSGKDISCYVPDKLKEAQKQAQNQVATPNSVPFLPPQGITSVTSVSSKRSLLVIGEASGIEDFKKTISMLDVPQTQIQIKTEVYEVKPGTMSILVPDQQPGDKKPEPNSLKSVYISPDNLTSLKTQLQSEGAQLRSSPIIIALSNQPASVCISQIIPCNAGAAESGDPKKFIEIKDEIRVLARVNADNIITLNFQAIVPRADKSDVENAKLPESPLKASFRMKSGESMMLYETAEDTENRLLFIVTPAIVKDTSAPQPGAGVIN